MGALDPLSVIWSEIAVETAPDHRQIRGYARELQPQRDMLAKYFADLRRVCEVEDTVSEWFLQPYVTAPSLSSHVKRRFNTDQFGDQFEVQSVELGGIDFSVWKVRLTAKKVSAYKFYDDLHIGVRVGETVCNEVKRCGFLIDRGLDVEVRHGDQLVVYVSMGGFEK